MGGALQLVLSALHVSAVYALIAAGFSLIFATSKVAQFGAGNVVVFGGALFAALDGPLPPLAALVVTMVCGAVLGSLVYLGVIRLGEKLGASTIALSIGALAVGQLLDAVTGLWTDDQPQVATPVTRGAFTVGGTRIPVDQVFVIGVVAVLLVGLYVTVFSRTTGKSMVAIAHRPTVAIVSGVDPRRVNLLAWVLSAMLMASAGALLLPSSVITRGEALPLSVAGFAAAIIGGLGSLPGAMVGAVVVGFAQTLFARYVSSTYTDLLVFGILFALLVAKPAGLFAARNARLA